MRLKDRKILFCGPIFWVFAPQLRVYCTVVIRYHKKSAHLASARCRLSLSIQTVYIYAIGGLLGNLQVEFW